MCCQDLSEGKILDISLIHHELSYLQVLERLKASDYAALVVFFRVRGTKGGLDLAQYDPIGSKIPRSVLLPAFSVG